MTPELTRPLALVAGAAASFAAALEFDASGRTVAAVFFLSVLAVLSAIDVEERRIPNRIVLPAAAVMLALQIALEPGRALEWTVAALGAGALLLVLARTPSGRAGPRRRQARAAPGRRPRRRRPRGARPRVAPGRGVRRGARHPSRARRPPGDGPVRAVPGRRGGRRPARLLGRAPSQAGKTDLRWSGDLVEAAAQHATTSSVDALAFVLGEHGVDDATVAAARVRADAAGALADGADAVLLGEAIATSALERTWSANELKLLMQDAARRRGGRGRRARRARVRRGGPESGDARTSGGPCDRGPAGAARRFRRRSRGVALACRGRRRQLRCARRCSPSPLPSGVRSRRRRSEQALRRPTVCFISCRSSCAG